MSKYNTREIISRKLRLFALLLFMDTDNPYNKVIISQIQDEAASASFYEAFFESAPQLLFQVQDFCFPNLELTSTFAHR